MSISVRKSLYEAQWSWLMFIFYAIFGWKDNVIRFIPLFTMIVLSEGLAIFVKKTFEIPEWVAMAVSFVVVFSVAWILLLMRLLLFVPFPTCKKGKCSNIDDYSFFHGTFFGKCKWGVYWYKCRCGDQYLRRGKKFMEFIPEVKEPPSPW